MAIERPARPAGALQRFAAAAADGDDLGVEGLPSEIVWPYILAIQIVLLVLVLNHCVIRELGRVISEE